MRDSARWLITYVLGRSSGIGVPSEASGSPEVVWRRLVWGATSRVEGRSDLPAAGSRVHIRALGRPTVPNSLLRLTYFYL